VAKTQIREQSPLQTGRGTTTINDAVVTSIVCAAGAGGLGRRAGDLLHRISVETILNGSRETFSLAS
jgi:hypothetical protein